MSGVPSTPLPAWPAGAQIVFMARRFTPLPGVPSTPMPAMPGPGVPSTPRPGWPAGAQRVTYRPALHPPATPPALPRPAAQNSAGVQSGQDVTQRIPSAPALAESAAQAEPGVQRGPGVTGTARREAPTDQFVPRNRQESRAWQRDFWLLTLHSASRSHGRRRRRLDQGRSRSSSRSRSPLPFSARNVDHLPLHHVRTSAGAVLHASDFECAQFPFELRMFPMLDPPLAGVIVFVRETPLVHIRGVLVRLDIPIGAVGEVLERNETTDRQTPDWRDFVVVRFFGNPDLPPRIVLHWYYFV